MAYTPRPWNFDENDLWVVADNGDIVCQLWDKFEEDYKNSEAHGVLIAAAPDLLAACIPLANEGTLYLSDDLKYRCACCNAEPQYSSASDFEHNADCPITKLRAAIAKAEDKWEEYLAEGNDYIPVDQWGQDHWSTFAYLETCVVNNRGIVDNRRMRCHRRLHREFAWNIHGGPIMDGSRYPTRLRDDETREKHDDWSCLEDMVAAGVIKAWRQVVRIGETFGNSRAKIALTSLGFHLAAQLRQHKASGGNFRDFVPPIRTVDIAG